MTTATTNRLSEALKLSQEDRKRGAEEDKRAIDHAWARYAEALTGAEVDADTLQEIIDGLNLTEEQVAADRQLVADEARRLGFIADIERAEAELKTRRAAADAAAHALRVAIITLRKTEGHLLRCRNVAQSESRLNRERPRLAEHAIIKPLPVAPPNLQAIEAKLNESGTSTRAAATIRRLAAPFTRQLH